MAFERYLKALFTTKTEHRELKSKQKEIQHKRLSMIPIFKFYRSIVTNTSKYNLARWLVWKSQYKLFCHKKIPVVKILIKLKKDTWCVALDLLCQARVYVSCIKIYLHLHIKKYLSIYNVSKQNAHQDCWLRIYMILIQHTFIGQTVYYSVNPSSNLPFGPLRSKESPQFYVVSHFRYIYDIS